MTLRYRDESFIRFCFVIYVFQFRVLWLFCFLLFFFFFNILFLFCVFVLCVFFVFPFWHSAVCFCFLLACFCFGAWVSVLACVRSAKQQRFVRASRFLYISFSSLHDYDVKLPNSTSYGRREHKTTTFPGLRSSPLEFNCRKTCQHLTN